MEEFILDGEVVALDARGRSSFERLQQRLSCSDPDTIARARAEVPVVLYAFDLLFAAGHDLRDCPLRARKRILERFLPRRGGVRFADHVEGEGEALFEAASEQGLEGIVAKDAGSRYAQGRRSRSWLKVKVPRRARGRGLPARSRVAGRIALADPRVGPGRCTDLRWPGQRRPRRTHEGGAARATGRDPEGRSGLLGRPREPVARRGVRGAPARL